MDLFCNKLKLHKKIIKPFYSQQILKVVIGTPGIPQPHNLIPNPDRAYFM